MGLDAKILVFWMLNFKPAFSLSSFTVIKRPFCFSSLSALEWYHLHIWGCWFLPAVLIPACESSSSAFCMKYSACHPSVLGGPAQHGSQPHWVTQAPSPRQGWRVLCVYIISQIKQNTITIKNNTWFYPPRAQQLSIFNLIFNTFSLELLIVVINK